MSDTDSVLQTPELSWIVSRYEALQASLNGLKGSSIDALRKQGYEEFSRLGFPTPKNEEWKYTNLRPFVSRSFEMPVQEMPQLEGFIEKLSVTGLNACKLIFLDGKFQPESSDLKDLPEGMEFGSIRQVLHDPPCKLRELLESRLGSCASHQNEALVGLNSALLDDGAVIRVRKGSEVASPVHMIFLSSGIDDIAICSRVLIVAEPQSSSVFLESYASLSDGSYFTNAVTEIIAEEGSRVEHYKIGLESSRALHTGKIASHLAKDSRVSSYVFTTGGSLVRNEVNPVLDGTGCEAVLNGLTILRAKQHVDNHTVIDHAQPHCESHELYKGIYQESSRGVFSGTIIVQPGAQKTNAIQNNQSLLLSANASVESKPQLKIWADDVKCTHGATIGQLDEDALFYLRSRGISSEIARNMLVHAFASDVTKEVAQAELRQYFENLLMEQLGLVEE